jgi:hypothetical protein
VGCSPNESPTTSSEQRGPTTRSFSVARRRDQGRARRFASVDASGTQPRARQLIDTAQALLDAVNSDGLTIRRLVDELRFRAPSLYKHVNGRPALELALVETSVDVTGLAMHAAVAGSKIDPVVTCLAPTGHRTCHRAVRPDHRQLVSRRRAAPPVGAWTGEPSFLAVGSRTYPKRCGPLPMEHSSSSSTGGSSTGRTSTGPGKPAPRYSPSPDLSFFLRTTGVSSGVPPDWEGVAGFRPICRVDVGAASGSVRYGSEDP